MTRTTENGNSINKVKFIFNCQWKKPDAMTAQTNNVRVTLTLPELEEDLVTSLSRPKILQTEKSVGEVLRIRDLLSCAERTSESTSEITDFI